MNSSWDMTLNLLYYLHKTSGENNANLPDASRINSKPQTVYYFTNPKSESNDGRTIKIGKTFLFLDIDLPVESEHIAYYRWIADIICYLNDIKIFKPTRIGMRKFNTFYILESQIEGMKGELLC